MRTSVMSLYAKMQRELERVSIEETNVLKSAIESIKIVRSYLETLRKEFTEQPFSSVDEEIDFFKIQKPKFEKHLQFEIRRHEIEILKVEQSKEALEKQLKKEHKQIESDFVSHREFYYYYKSGKTFMDEQLFTRAGSNEIIYPEYIMLVDADFSTMHGYLVARIEANELMRNYLSLFDQQSPAARSSSSTAEQTTIKWTGSKTDCVEFIYGLFANGCLNNGRMDIKAIATFVQRTFNIDLGNYYRVFQDIRIRDERTKYHNKTVSNLVSLMDYSDENPRFH